jgi:hypothetical protein
VGVNVRLTATAQAHIERETESLRPERPEPGGNLGRALHGDTADDDTRDPHVEERLDSRGATHAAADLQVYPCLAGEVSDEGGIEAHTVSRAVEIDDVNPACTERAIAPKKRPRGDGVLGLGGEIALGEADAVAAPQINGGDEQHVV